MTERASSKGGSVSGRAALLGLGSIETALSQLIRVFSCILLLWRYYTPSLLPFDSPTCLDRRAQPFSVFPFLFGSFWELRLTLKGSSSYFHFIYMDHSSVYKITFFFFTLPMKRGLSHFLDPACIYINFFHIFESRGTSKHKENEQTRKAIEWVLEKAQI